MFNGGYDGRMEEFFLQHLARDIIEHQNIQNLHLKEGFQATVGISRVYDNKTI